MDRVKSQTSSNAAVFGEEWKRFIKMFPTAGAMISTLGIVKESFFTHERDILNNGKYDNHGSVRSQNYSEGMCEGVV